MIIPIPKRVADEQAAAYTAPDPLQMKLRAEAWELTRQGSTAEAVEVWQKILAARYDDADAANELGLAFATRDKPFEAVEAFERALQFGADPKTVKLNLGRSLLKIGKYAEARIAFDDVAIGDPKAFDALAGVAAALRGLNRRADALATAQRVVEQAPTHGEGLLEKAEALNDLKRPDEAIAVLRQLLEVHPGHQRGGILLGRVLREQFRGAEAVAVLHDVDQEHPAEPDVLNELGSCLLAARDYAEADEVYRRLIALHPASAAHLCNHSVALSGLSRFEDAIAACRRALAIEPSSSTAQFNLAFIYLTIGRLDEGWAGYEHRFSGSQPAARGDLLAAPWCGEDLRGKSIMVLGEQANGDYLQFIRYLVPLVEMGASVSFMAPKRLIGILSTLPVPVTFVEDLDRRARYDFQCHLISLPGHIRRLGLPIPAAPYLRADPERVARWRARIGAGGLRIGIAWHGAIYTGPQAQRAFRLEHLRPVAEVPGVRLISLQMGKGAEQIAALAPSMAVETLGPGFDAGDDGFLDAAAAIECLDLVISCDTSLAHLAGALGAPVWIALNEAPEWRWQRQRDDSDWYASARLFRQTTRGDWDGVFRRMAEALRKPLELRRIAEIAPIASPRVDVSWGELIDKIAILEIKAGHATDAGVLDNVGRELSLLEGHFQKLTMTPELESLRAELRQVNAMLWGIEDELRHCESHGQFDAAFVSLARSVYHQNDKRARLKRDINLLTRSALIEEKIHPAY